MSSKKSYNRFFIIFQEEDKGYGMGPDRPPTGYAKVETKNDKSKVTVYVQNLKPFETGECLYRCYLISHQDDKDCAVYLGIMNIDELGRGECSWECGADNAFDSKISVDKFNGAAVVVDREGNDKVIAPLAGYMSKEKFDWRNKISLAKHSQAVEDETVEVKEEKVEASEEAQKFQEYENSLQQPIVKENEAVKEELQTAGAVKESQTTEATKETQTAEAIKEAQTVEAVKELQTAEIVKEAQTAEAVQGPETIELKQEQQAAEVHADQGEVYIKSAIPSSAQDINETVRDNEPQARPQETAEYPRHKHKEHRPGYHEHDDNCKNNYRHIIRNMLEDILADYEKMDKHKDLKDCVLWKVDMAKCRRDIYKCSMYPCYDLVFYPMMYNPMCNYYNYIAKHGHYLFGIKYDKDRKVMGLVYGIPGTRKPCDQPMSGKTGFIRWVALGPGQDGYWIMVYDPMTGAVTTQK